jgi:hypothetical protein
VPALRTVIAVVALATIGVDIGVAVDRSGDSSSSPATQQQQQSRQTPAPTCAEIKASKVKHPAAPHPATLLKPLRFPAFGITLRPAGHVQFLGASPGLVWHKWRADGVVERLAHYRLFLARVTDRGMLSDQLSWVVLQRGVATPDPAASPSKCTINGNELDLYDAQTGQAEAVAAGADAPDPFSREFASWWRR